MAARFDLESLTMTGSPEVVLEGIRTEGSGHGQFTVSRTGTLIYVAGGAGGAGTLGWADRRGGFVPLPVPAQVYGNFRISHDGRHLAVEVYSPLSDVWIYDFERAAMTRLTVDGKNGNPVWSLDDKRVAFRSQRSGVSGILLKAVDGSAAEEQLITGVSLAPDRWSPDGNYLAFTEPHPGTSWDISILPLDGDRKPRPFLNSQFSEWGPVFCRMAVTSLTFPIRVADMKSMSSHSRRKARDGKFPRTVERSRYGHATGRNCSTVMVKNGWPLTFRPLRISAQASDACCLRVLT